VLLIKQKFECSKRPWLFTLQEKYLGSSEQTVMCEDSIQIPLAVTHFWSAEFTSMCNTWKGLMFPVQMLHACRLVERDMFSCCRIWGSACCLLHAGFLLGLFFNPEDRGNIFLQYVYWLSSDCTVFIPEDRTLVSVLAGNVFPVSVNQLKASDVPYHSCRSSSPW
jgi:hypothetical protein